MNNKDLDKLIEVINTVKNAAEYNEVVLYGNKESFEKLRESGFPLENYKYCEIQSDESNIFVIPYKPKDIKLYIENSNK